MKRTSQTSMARPGDDIGLTFSHKLEFIFRYFINFLWTASAMDDIMAHNNNICRWPEILIDLSAATAAIVTLRAEGAVLSGRSQ